METQRETDWEIDMTLRTAYHDTLFMARTLAAAGLERASSGLIFNPSSPQQTLDPYPLYKRLRETDPMHRSHAAGGWVLSRHDDVRAVLGDKSFSADERNWSLYQKSRNRAQAHGLDDPYENDRMTMLRMDPPDHTRLRKLVSKAFTPRAIESLRDRAQAILDELLRHQPKHGGIELVRELAAPFPIILIAEMLGVPSKDRDRFRFWSDEAVKTLGDNSFEDIKQGLKAMEEFGAYIEAVADERRASPRDDLLSGLVAVNDGDGDEDANDRLTKPELLMTCVLLMVAGNETTTNLIGNSVLALLEHTDQRAILQAEPKRIAGAVDEFLRYDSPVQLTSRIATHDHELHGARIRRGQQILLLLGSANRDEAVFEHPDRLDVTRDASAHLSFSHGLHHCLGAQLARLEGGLALEAILSRFPDLALADDAERAVRWGTNSILRGPQELNLVF